MNNNSLWVLGGIIVLLAIIAGGQQFQPESNTDQQYPQFVRNFKEDHPKGQIYRFSHEQEIYYAMSSDVSPGLVGGGYGIYNSEGVSIGTCNGSLGPQYWMPICNEAFSGIIIWKGI